MSERSIVVDANILIRAVLGKRVRDLIFQHHQTVSFLAPEVCFVDAKKYLPQIFKERCLDPCTAIDVLEKLGAIISIVDSEIYGEHEQEAKARMKNRDLEDWPIVATSLLLNCPIWTEDRDFFGSGIPTWTTDRVHIFLDSRVAVRM